MTQKTSFLQISIRIAGMIILVLGVIFWLTKDVYLVGYHIAIGVILVLLLWGLVYRAIRADISLTIVILVTVWSLLLPFLGMTQAKLLPGPAHWVIHVVHVVVGVGIIAAAEFLFHQINNKRLQAKLKKNKMRPRIRK
jgi:hypothetical protein